MCKEVVRKHLGGVTLDRNAGEMLRHTVVLLEGAAGLFSIVDNASGSTLLTNASPQNPPFTWTREWPLAGDTSVDTIHGLLLQFASAKSYTWRVDHLSAAGHVLETPLDVDYSDDTPTDHCQDVINVFVS
jgi:hypothetical protein